MFMIVIFSAICLCGLIMLYYRLTRDTPSNEESIPVALDYARSFFPVLVLVFVLRGFVAEPFRIPSGSMLPTLELQDFILVNKYTYGIRLPITHQKVLDVSKPERGDIVVFRYPPDPSQNYIKRLIGLPGDKIEYSNKRLLVNGEEVSTSLEGNYTPEGARRAKYELKQTIPTGDGKTAAEFSILHSSQRGFYGSDSWIVPEGKYFMMGDNRDNSLDSRAWGFVPDENIIGKAFFIWMSFGTEEGSGLDYERIGNSIGAEEVVLTGG